MVDLLALKTEIQTDPRALGYVGKTSHEAQLLINAPGGSGETIEPGHVAGSAMIVETDVAEFEALTAGKRELWLRITAYENVPIKNAKLRAIILNIWGAGTATRAALAALQTRTGSRAEVLFGEGVTVQAADITQALAS